MKENKLKLHPCYCGGEMKIKKVAQNSGMDGTYWDWELTCSKCGLTKTYAADGFYGRKYKTLEEVVNDWNWKKEEIIRPLEQQTCEDAISRQAVLSYIYNDLGLGDEENGSDIERMIELERFYKYVKSLKPVTPKPKTGHWIEHEPFDADHHNCNVCIECSNCHTWFEHDCYAKTDYCPKCGAKMIESQEREE